MQKPQNITIAGICMLVASLSGFFITIMMAILSALLWVPAYTCMPLMTIWSFIIGITLLSGIRKGSGLAISGAVTAMLLLLNCDLISAGLGAAALYFLTRPDAAAWLNNQDTLLPGGMVAGPTQAPEGATGIQFNASFFPLAFMLNMTAPQADINGHVHKLPWGRLFLDLPPGDYTLDLHVPYLGTRHGAARTTVTLAQGEVAQFSYSAPMIMFMAGTLRRVA